MGNSLRCCLACVLPCGALDVIRIVHLNGQVREYSRPIPAQEILAAHPGHVLSKPCAQAGVAGRILIVSPESELRRGSIYFLIPARIPEKRKKRKSSQVQQKIKEPREEDTDVTAKKAVDQDSYMADILSEKKTGYRRRRCGRVGVWRPHLESISEDP